MIFLTKSLGIITIALMILAICFLPDLNTAKLIFQSACATGIGMVATLQSNID